MYKIYTLAFLLFSFTFSFSQDYKKQQIDNAVNFYDVVREGEAYFNTIDKDAKGSGYKQFNRWKNANEYKYYPSGDRSNVDPYFPQNAYKDFLQNNPDQNRMVGESWEEVGPNVVNRITGHYAAGLGRIEDFWVDPTNDDLIYLVSASGGFWKTNNGGASWTGGATDHLFACGSNAITVNPNNNQDIIINIRNSGNSISHGLYRSTDGGDTWNLTNFNPVTLGTGGLGSTFIVYKVAFHPTNPNIILVGTNNGLYRTTDSFANLTHTFVSMRVSQLEFHPTNPNRVYMFLNNFQNTDIIQYSSDAGVTFAVSNEIPGQGNSSAQLSVTADCPNCVYFASSQGVWKSVNQGVDFTMLSGAPSGLGLYGGFAVSDTDEDVIIYGSQDTFRSTDNGTSFAQCTWWSFGSAEHGGGSNQDAFENSQVYVHADNRNMKAINGVFYAATDGFLCKSEDDGATWAVLSQGVGTRENYKLGISQSNVDRIILGSQDNGTTIHNENEWIEYYGADGMEGIIHPLNDDWMIGSIQFGGRIGTKNGEESTFFATPEGESGSGFADWQAPIAYDPNNQMRIYHFSEEVHRSEDFGSTWTELGNPSFSGVIVNAEIAYNDSQIMLVSRGGALEKSTDGGATFTSVANGLPNATIQDIAFDPNDDNRFIVVYAPYEATNQKVYMSENGGTSYTNITHNLSNMPIHSVVFDYDTDNRIYLGAEIGVYTKLRSENTWSLYSTDLPNVTVEELEINRGANMLFAATWGRGMWRIPLKDKEDFASIRTVKITDEVTDEFPVDYTEQFVTATIDSDAELQSVEVLWSIDNPTFTNSINMTQTDGNTFVSDTALPGHELDVKMYFKVKATTVDGNVSETYKYMFTYREYLVCEGFGNVYQGTPEYISSTTIGTTVTTSDYDGYVLHDANPIELVAGREYPIEIQLGFHYNGDEAIAYIDFNRDSVFDESESITMSDYSDTFLSTGVLTVPLDAVRNQPLILRLRNNYLSDSICGTEDGDVEDYMVILRDPCSDLPLTTWDGNQWSNGLPSEILNVEYLSSHNTNGVDIEACSCKVSNNAVLTIADGDYLKTTGPIEVASGSTLNVENGASVVQLDDQALVTNNGTINVLLETPELKPRDIIFLGSPMSLETNSDVFVNANRVMEHVTENFVPHPDVTTEFPLAENFADDNYDNFLHYTGTIKPGEGYLIRPRPVDAVGNEVYTMNFTEGTLNNGEVTFRVKTNDSKASSFNMLANPYPSAIDLDLFIDENETVTEVYFWEHILTPDAGFPGADVANFSMEDISMYNKLGGMAATNESNSTPNGFIGTGQGFAIKANDDDYTDENDTFVATFNNAMRVVDNESVRSLQTDTNRLWLEVNNTTYEKMSSTLIGFTAEATSGFDPGYDSNRMATVVSLYSHLTTVNNEKKELGIQSREAFNTEQEILLGFSTLIDEVQTYSINIKDLEGTGLENAIVYLLDTQEDITTNLSKTDYSFTAEKGTFNERFVLYFQDRNALNTNAELVNTIKMYPNPTQGKLTVSSPLSSITNIVITDVQGRIIDAIEIANKLQCELSLLQYETAVYFVTVTTESGSITKRIVKK